MSDATPARLEELPLEECLQLLREGSVGRIAVLHDEYPVVLPVNYRLVEASGRTWVAFRTRKGNVIDEAPMHAAFQIDAIDQAHRQGTPPTSVSGSIRTRGSAPSATPG